MPKSKAQKSHVLEQTKKELETAKSAVLATFSELTVNDDQDLRKQLKEQNVTHRVIKKTLLKNVFKQLNLDADSIDSLTGNVSLSLSPDEVSAAKILAGFAKTQKDFKIQGGVLEGIWIDETKVGELSMLPTKPELLVQVALSMQAPLAGFARVLQGNLQKLVLALNAIKEKRS